MVSNSMHSSLRELVPLQFEIVTQPEGKKKGEMWGVRLPLITLCIGSQTDQEYWL